MKRLLILICVILNFSITARSSELRILIDERIELTSIAFRLADAQEYVTDCAPTYLKEVDDYFSKYKNHPLIKYIKELRDNEQFNVGYGLVASSAFLFDIKHGHIKPNLDERKDLSIVYHYWPEECMLKYLKLLDSFYVDTKFERFWNKSVEFRDRTKEESEKVIRTNMTNMNWFDEFFSCTPETVNIYLAMANGLSNYSLGSLNIFPDNQFVIVIGCNCEADGAPAINQSIMNVVPHELCHSYGKHLSKSYLSKCIDSFKIIYPDICQQTKLYGYGDKSPKTAASESFAELFADMYLAYIGYQFVGYKIAEDENRGYVWMSDAIRFMQNFTENRDEYPSINEFMPQLIAYYNELPGRWESIMKKFAARAPYVESTYPAKNSTVSADIKELRVTFSHPMIDAFGKRKLNGYENVVFQGVQHSPDNRTIIIPLLKPLEKGKTYGFAIPAAMLVSADTYHRVKEDYQFIFKTEE